MTKISKERKLVRAVLLLAIFITILFGLFNKDIYSKRYSEERFLMGTTVTLLACRENHDTHVIQQAFNKAWERLEDISWRMNVYDEKSDVSVLNNSHKAVDVGQDTLGLLKRAKKISEMTQGRFDITVWPIIEIWQKAQIEQIMPTQQEINSKLNAIGMDRIKILDNGKVMLTNKDTKVDLGAIAKGYAVDEAARILRENNITSFFVDAGGDVYAGGFNCDGDYWKIGIRHPVSHRSLINTVQVINKSVASSGDYAQGFTIAGEQFSHIINPISGRPQEYSQSATVIAPTAEEADALATALCVLPPQEGIGLINSLGDDFSAAVYVTAQNRNFSKFPSATFSNYLEPNSQ